MMDNSGADPALVQAPGLASRPGPSGFDQGERKPIKQGAPELAYIAQAVFRASFADDEDEQLVKQKWCEWEDDRAKAIRTAHFVIRALGGWGKVVAATGGQSPPAANEDVLNNIGGYADAFYEIAALVGVVGPIPKSPKWVYEVDLLPSLKAMVERDKLWNWLAQNVNIELTFGEVNNDLSDCAWHVHRVNGGISDREWTLIATGNTPLDAIRAARGKQQ